MNRLDFQKERTDIITEMIESPDEKGIYSTSVCFTKIDNLFDKAFKDLYEEIKHGDEEHKKWLKDKINHFIGRDVC